MDAFTETHLLLLTLLPPIRSVSYKQQRPIHSGSRTCTVESSGAKRLTRKHDGDDNTHHSLLPPPIPRELTTAKWAKAGGLGRTAATETPLVLQGASATRLKRRRVPLLTIPAHSSATRLESRMSERPRSARPSVPTSAALCVSPRCPNTLWASGVTDHVTAAWRGSEPRGREPRARGSPATTTGRAGREECAPRSAGASTRTRPPPRTAKEACTVTSPPLLRPSSPCLSSTHWGREGGGVGGRGGRWGDQILPKRVRVVNTNFKPPPPPPTLPAPH